MPNRRSLAAIRFPDDGAIYSSGSSLTLRGLGYDAEDGTLPTIVLSWTLTTQGGLGYGNNLKLAGLADGQYTLSLTVTDADDQTSSTSVTFQIIQIRDTDAVYLPTIIKP